MKKKYKCKYCNKKFRTKLAFLTHTKNLFKQKEGKIA